jgi:hypothetical protein
VLAISAAAEPGPVHRGRALSPDQHLVLPGGRQRRVLDPATLLGSIAIGAGLMAFVVGVLALGNRFGYPDSA